MMNRNDSVERRSLNKLPGREKSWNACGSLRLLKTFSKKTHITFCTVKMIRKTNYEVEINLIDWKI